MVSPTNFANGIMDNTESTNIMVVSTVSTEKNTSSIIVIGTKTEYVKDIRDIK